MARDTDSGNLVLVVTTGMCACALPLPSVIETLRPLPIEPIPGALAFVRGVSILRGIPTPVIDLGAFLGSSAGQPTRFVTLRAGDRQAAISVGAVRGVWELDSPTLRKLPPLLHGASNDMIDAIGTLDQQVLMVLRDSWQLPEEVWHGLGDAGKEKKTCP